MSDLNDEIRTLRSTRIEPGAEKRLLKAPQKLKNRALQLRRKNLNSDTWNMVAVFYSMACLHKFMPLYFWCVNKGVKLLQLE